MLMHYKENPLLLNSAKSIEITRVSASETEHKLINILKDVEFLGGGLCREMPYALLPAFVLFMPRNNIVACINK